MVARWFMSTMKPFSPIKNNHKFGVDVQTNGEMIKIDFKTFPGFCLTGMKKVFLVFIYSLLFFFFPPNLRSSAAVFFFRLEYARP